MRSGSHDRLRHFFRRCATVPVAVTVIGLHVADDSFFQPQPGRHAGDHLISGLAPLCLLAAAAVGYRRLRGASRSVLIGTVGVFGVVTGVEGVYYAAHGRASGDDYTGLAAMAVGLILLGAALVALWTTRRRDGARWRRYGRRAALALSVPLVGFYVVLPLTVAYVATHVGRLPAGHVDLGANAVDVQLTRSDGVRLAASYIPSRNGAAVIAFPGREGPQEHARMLERHGFGVLLFDQTGDGGSQGDPNGFGWDGGEGRDGGDRVSAPPARRDR